MDFAGVPHLPLVHLPMRPGEVPGASVTAATSTLVTKAVPPKPVKGLSALTTLEFHRLNNACMVVTEHFGHSPYLVGSATESADYRDVDIRLILADDEFDAMFPNGRLWSALCLGLSAYLSQASGLPVDFQVQRQTEANKKYSKPRNPIGTRARWFAGMGDATPFDRFDYDETGAL